jgi:hypothetical protein
MAADRCCDLVGDAQLQAGAARAMIVSVSSSAALVRASSRQDEVVGRPIARTSPQSDPGPGSGAVLAALALAVR